MTKQIEIPETPLMQQYQSLKNSYPHALLFFRLGDFYEMFYEDAKVASRILGLVLTSRQEVPMCGVPFHSVSNYISKLLEAGHKVAICEQIAPETDSKKTKLFKREVVRLITPGTIIEDELLETKISNYLACVEIDIVGWGLSYIEASTGEFFSTQCLNDPGFYQLSSLLSRLNPSEIIADTKTLTEFKKRNVYSQKTTLTEYLKIIDLNGNEWKEQSVWQNHKLALKTALNVISYIRENQPGLKEVFVPSYFEISNKMQMDESAIKTLELVETQDSRINCTLWGVLDNARTAMGSRLLKKWVLEPLVNIQEIHKRQNFVAMLVDNANKRDEMAEILQEIPDVERILGRVLNLSVSARDVSAIRKALQQIPRLKMFLSSISTFEPVGDIMARIESVSANLESLKELLQKAIVSNPPAKISDGGVIKEHFNAELDSLRSLRKDSQKLLIEIEAREREKTQISSLKVSYNSVFGYYIEVTKPHLSKVPNYYVRKQTLVNAERFITQDLKELESKILGAEERMLKLEFHLFTEIKEAIFKNLKNLRSFALAVSELDAFYGLAVSAVRYDYVRPEVTLDDGIFIEEGRHPVVERYLPSGSFVPNDLKIGSDNPGIMILTGPNMSGKSVYLRQNALITIMAQMGSFVPAVSARIGIVDRIMTRIGAHDKLFSGESTFMVEMKETSSILNLATDKSLILLDEVGRGTSTFDGISIAWAVVEYLHKQKSRAKVLFATHYFELTELAEKLQNVRNFNVSVKEWTNALGKTEVVFLHKIVPGPADKSYGIHVAQLAGLPDSCIKRAKEILKKLESKSDIKVEGNGETEPLLPIFSSHPVLDEIKLCDPDKMTPLEALNAVHEWKKRLQ